MILLYRILTALIYLLLYPYGRFRASRGSRLWQGRLGLVMGEGPVDLWMHAASVGEVKVIGFLVDYLKKQSNGLKIRVSTMTRQGYKIASENLSDKASISYFPLDAGSVMKQFLSKIRPRMIVVAETEIWPNLVRQAAAHGIPIVLVNGRMSPGSFGKYRMIAGSMRNTLAKYDRFFFKTVEDAERYRYFGVGDDRSEVAGDMKFDAPLLPRSVERIAEIRSQWGVEGDKFLLVAGSTRSGEEATLIGVYQRLIGRSPLLRLVLAPRHVERAAEVKSLLDSEGVRWYTYGETPGADDKRGAAVVLVDRMGVLNDLYLAADLAFVGGTLVDIGGHNLLEPVWAGTPVLYGPSLANVAEAAQYIEAHRYGAQVASSDKLAEAVESVIEGRTKFEVKTESDLSRTATVKAGKYILERLKHV